MEQQQLLSYKIYDFLPWETEKPLMLEHWKDFVKKAIQEDYVYVFNCVFLQNPMCETMMRFNLPEEQIYEYIEQINQIISPLEPMIVYLENDDVEEQVRKTAKERAGWLEAVIDYHVNGGYGKSISASGFDGYISCLKERQRRELEYLEKSKVHNVIIENAHRNWEQAYKMINVHAGAFETACMREIYPEAVRENTLARLEPTFLQGEQIGKWCNGAAEDKALIPNGYVGDPGSSQYIKTNLKEADGRIARDIANRFGQRRLKTWN